MVNEISEKLILKHLKTPKKVAVFDEVYSTNDTVKELDVDLVIAKSQTGGRGTNNRKFFSPNGGIYLSLKLKPKIPLEKLSLITPFTAVALAKAIEKVTGLKPKIKWVNDIYISGKKVAGILTESKILSGNIDYVIVGVGVNVKSQKFPNFNLNTPTSLEEELGGIVDKNRLIAEFLNEFNGVEKSLLSKDFINYYNDNFYLLDKKVKVVSGGKEYQGVAIGVDENLALLVKIQNKTISFISGDVTVL